MAPPITQIALCTDNLPRSIRLYTEAFGFASARGRLLWGERVARIQDVGPDVEISLWWLVGRQDFFQLEFFNHTTPPQRPLPADWRPSDHGFTRFGITVPDFDGALARLAGLGVGTLTEPVVHDGLRRVCFRDPTTGIPVEVMEEGGAVPGGIRPRHYDLVPAVVYTTLSVPDLDRARAFLVGTLGLEEEPGVVLHTPEHEALWGLPGAKSEGFVVRGGDVYLEVVRYDDPPGRPRPDGHLLSDQGLMNIAVGFRDRAPMEETYNRIVENGYRVTNELPPAAGGTYLFDDQGNSYELLISSRDLDPDFGFSPERPFGRRPIWPQAAVGPATE